MFTAADVDPEAALGRSSSRLYRRVTIAADWGYRGIVRYDPALETAVSDVRKYISRWLNRQVGRYGENVINGRLYSPLDVTLPGEPEPPSLMPADAHAR